MGRLGPRSHVKAVRGLGLPSLWEKEAAGTGGELLTVAWGGGAVAEGVDGSAHGEARVAGRGTHGLDPKAQDCRALLPSPLPAQLTHP